MYDLIIIGSGPAGLSAAVYAMRAKLFVAVIEKEAYSGGQIIYSEQVDNYLGMPGKSGAELSMAFKEHADSMEVPFLEGTVTAIRKLENDYEVILANADCLRTKTVLIASGATHRKLGVPGEDRFIGKGVSYCATCDGAFFRDKDVAVVGGGDVALGDALYLSKLCRRVYLIHRRDGFRAAKVLQEQVSQKSNIEFLPFYEVNEMTGNDTLEQLSLKENRSGEMKQIEVSGVFIAVGMYANTDFVKNTVALDFNGYVVAGEDGITDMPGLFAAGDVRTKKVRQIVTAVSDGANALYSVEEYLAALDLVK